ncbi:MAG: cytochrome c maturation protein CcmE [Ignavibacteria bacterium]|nr:cytochrome c maturation protein CcmE [Ignavibacteria bacterium]MBI3765358.1 cytochrome c maturation protein CcmE [Ignavibacteriales bacterium]
MKIKIIIASIVIVAAIIFGAISFVETNVEYTDFHTAATSHKKVQVKGAWVKDKESLFDAATSQFVFYMKDDFGREEKVVYDGAKPNNFEIANAVVVKGRYHDGYFHASEILTKCPSKYEADGETVKKTL